MDWKTEAAQMYLGGSSINDIAAKTKKSRQAVSGYLKTLPEYDAEKNRRKEKNHEKRKEYKRLKNREYRMQTAVTVETMRREHDIAAVILSHERY